MRRAALSALLLAAVMGWWTPCVPAAWAEARRCTGDPLPVVVEEGERQVRLRIRVGEEVDPGSVEVELDGSRVSVAASAVGSDRRRCSRDLQLHAAVVEEQPLADFEDGWLTITLSRARERDDTR
jgi:HSP20 family molecular chaperone IbpA